MQLLTFIVLGFVLIVAITTIFPKLTYSNNKSRSRSLNLILLRVLFINPNSLPRVHLKLMFLFFNLFWFFQFNFLGSAMTTDMVTIRTDELVDSPSKLISTSKPLLIHWRESDLIKMAPEQSFLKTISKKKIFEIYGLRDLIWIQNSGINQFVVFAVQSGLVHFIAIMSRHAKRAGLVAFIKSTNYYERLSVFEMRKSLDVDRKKFINSR